MEDALAGRREPEGHQLWDHLPGGRVVGEEATVPGGVDAGDRQPEQGWCQGPRGGATCPPATGALRPSPADHIAQGHDGQEQAQEEHQLEEEGGAGGPESPRRGLGVPHEGVLGASNGPWGSLASSQRPRSLRPREGTLRGRAEAGRGACPADGGPHGPPRCMPAPPSPRPHLLDVEGEEDEDAVEQGQQRAVEEAHPGDRLPRHNVQDVLGHQELLPVQPGPEPAREPLHQQPGAGRCPGTRISHAQ